MSIVQVLIISILAAANHIAGIWPCTFGIAISAGAITGFVLGDWRTGLIIGATCQTLTMSAFSVGGVNTLPDTAFAAVICTVLAIKDGISTDAALAIAATIAVLPTFIEPLRQVFVLDTIVTPLADKYAEKCDTKKLWMTQFILAPTLNTAFRAIMIAIGIIGGEAVIVKILDVMPGWLYTGFSALGSALPAIGFALYLHALGQNKYLPFFFLGFYICKYSGLSIIAIGIICVCIAMIYELAVDTATQRIKEAK